MPPKKGKGAKKQTPRLSEEDDIQIDQIDIQYNPDIVTSLVDDLAQHLEAKCAQIQKDSDFLCTSIQQAFHLELIKLPNQVKQMSMKRFKEEFGFSLAAVTKGSIGGPLKSYNDNSKMNMKGGVYQTPSQKSTYSTLTGTVARNPREGEAIMSKNGSPLGEFTTVKKAPREGGALCDKVSTTIPPPTPGVFVPLKTGEVIDVIEGAADVENMSQEAKAETLEKMQEVMQNMQSLMAKLSQPSHV